MTAWTHPLKADPTPWLLEPDNPPVRYRALLDLLGLPADDPQVQAARAAIPGWPPLAELLAAQGPEGDWSKGDFYLPRARGTFWVLSVLGELGLKVEDLPPRLPSRSSQDRWIPEGGVRHLPPRPPSLQGRGGTHP